ncbi:MAG: choice-of-anchor A family protein [Ignavibacteriaceae bacterium]|nr:choice-of-anchor A family protein [Ignavibacteriaceae bacterium]
MIRNLLTVLSLFFLVSIGFAQETKKVVETNFPPQYFQSPNGIEGSSVAKVLATDKGTNITYTNPYTNNSQSSFAGTLSGTIDGNNANFYCIDIKHFLVFWTVGQPHTYTDDGSTPAQITYLLNNYYPHNPYGYPGGASSVQKEAAAIQAAIWYFSDGLNVNTINVADVKTRALALIADANSNAGSVIPVYTLLITPSTQSVSIGNSASFTVSAFDINGNVLSNINVALSTSDGVLSTASATTTASGATPVVTLSQGSLSSATITATANVVIPHGTRYVHSTDPDTYQKLVLATPTIANLSVTGSVNWYTPELCDLNGFRTQTQGGWGSPNNSGPGRIRVLNFANVFPAGLTIGSGANKATFLTSDAIRNFLPAGSSPNTLTGSLVNPLTTSAGVLAGQLVAATINVYFSAAGVLGTNPQELGRLVIASGDFYGKTVYELLDIANAVISGASSAYTPSQVNDALTSLNENFDDGTVNQGYLDCGVPFASIGNKVWNDVNKNGKQDNGEAGVPGVVVNLYNCSDVFISTTSTDANGIYTFGNLVPGDYYVEFVLPANSAFTAKDQGSNDAKDSDADVLTGKTTCTSLAAGEDDMTWDAGIYSLTPCVTGWNGTLGLDEPVCYETPQPVIVGGSVTHTPNPSKAKMQTWWRVVFPIDLTTGYNYTNTQILNDTTFQITANWPGIRYNDTQVEVEYGVSILDCDGNVIGTPITKKVFWNPTICPPPPPNEADVKVVKTASKDSVQNGDNVTYTILATNMGPKDATGVVVTDVLPAGVDFISSSATVGAYNDVTGVWSIGNLANGANATLTITVKVDVTASGSGSFNLGDAEGFNVFVLYDVTQPSADTEGKMAVGRNAQLAQYSVGDKLPAYPYGQEDVLVVGNNLTFTSGAVCAGNVVYGNSTNLPIYGVSTTNGTVRKDSVIDFTAAEAYLKSLSATLGAYTNNGTTTYQWGGIFLAGTNPVLNVFHVDGTMLSTANNFSITAPNGSAVLVNIDGDSTSWSGGVSVNGTSFQNVIYNFYEAKYLKIQYINITGTVLAPLAKVNFVSGVQNGQMICKFLEGQGQFNDKLFIGSIPVDTTVVNVASIESTYPTDPNLLNNSSQASVKVGGTEQTSAPAGSWQQYSSLTSNQMITSLAHDLNGNLLSGTVGGSIYRAASDESWTMINEGMSVDYIWSMATAQNGNILAATEKGIYLSNDNGSNWSATELSQKEIRVLTVAANGIIYAGTWGYGVYKSIDNGATWQIINGGITSMNIRSITVASNGYVYAGSFDGGLFRSVNDGQDWVRLNIAYNFIYALGVSTNNVVIAGTYGSGIYRSTNFGDSWLKVNTDVSSQYIYSVNTDASNNIFVSTWMGGVLVSKDDGATWQKAGMSGFEVSSITVNTSDNTLFAGTGKGSVYKMVDGISNAKNETTVPTEFELKQNYPNPFNPSTKIEFSVANNERITITIYNILGQVVKTLVDMDYAPGKYTVNFDGANLASGVYIYNMKTNSTNFTKKMMLLK